MKKRLLIGGAALLWVGCSHQPPNPQVSPVTPVSVRTATVEVRQMGADADYPATVKSRRQAVLATKLPGRITYLQAEEGDLLSAGSVVAEIDVADLEARTAQAVAGRDSALAALQQSQAGYEQSMQSVARQRADQAATELRVAQSRVEQLQGQISAAQPISGGSGSSPEHHPTFPGRHKRGRSGHSSQFQRPGLRNLRAPFVAWSSKSWPIRESSILPGDPS